MRERLTEEKNNYEAHAHVHVSIMLFLMESGEPGRGGHVMDCKIMHKKVLVMCHCTPQPHHTLFSLDVPYIPFFFEAPTR
jgi:hypothetical protein